MQQYIVTQLAAEEVKSVVGVDPNLPENKHKVTVGLCYNVWLKKAAIQQMHCFIYHCNSIKRTKSLQCSRQIASKCGVMKREDVVGSLI